MLNLNAAGDGAVRNTNVVAASSDYTAMCWYRTRSTPSGGDYKTVFASFNDPTYTTWAGIFSEVDNLNYRVQTTTQNATNFTLIENLWYHLCYVRSGNDHLYYVNGVLIGTATENISASTFDTLRLGFDDFSNDEDSDFAYFREWDQALTAAEIKLEANSTVAIETTDLITDTPLESDGDDISGNGNDWSFNGTPTFSATPFILVPLTNTSAANAYEIASLPAELLQIVYDGATTQTVWFKFTAPINSAVAGAFGFGYSSGYSPTNRPYSDAGITNINGIAAVNKPLQFPITPGNTYWFRCTPNGGNPNPAALRTRIEIAPNELAETGDLVILDDAGGFPAAIVDPATGNVKRFLNPFPAGEQGDKLPISGRVLVSDEFIDFNLKLYTPNLGSLITDVAFSWIGVPKIRTCIGGNKFYVGSTGTGATPAEVTTVDSNGNLGPTTWVLPSAGMTAMAANNDETILYYQNGAAILNNEVRRWDLVNDVALPNFLGTVANHVVSDILILSDDTILIAYFKSTVTRAFYVERYNAAGTLLNTYTFATPATSTVPRLAYANDEPNSFWVFYHPAADINQFLNIKVSDGSTLASIDTSLFEGGAYQGTSAEDNPDFGTAFSCPLFVLNISDVRNASSGLYVLVPGKTNDTLMTEEGSEDVVEIPNPFFETGMIVDK